MRSIDQVLFFLETSERGPNISLSTSDTHVSLRRKLLATLFARSQPRRR